MRGLCRIFGVLSLGLAILMLQACTTTRHNTYAEHLPSQSEVASKLAKASMPSELREQIVQLYSQNATTRAEAAYRLAKMGGSAAPAVPYLVHQLRDETPVTLSHYLGGGYYSSLETTPATEASQALAKIGTPSVNALLLSLNDSNPNVRRLAVKALGQIGEMSSVDFLIRALNDPDRNVRATAAIALGNYRNPMAVQKIMDVYPTVSNTAQIDMIFALANIDDILAVPFLIQHANDPDPAVRAACMLALGKLRDGRAVPTLLKGLTDSDETTRANAAHALGSYYSPEIVTALINKLADKSTQVCEAAAESLTNLSGVNFGTDHSRWQSWWREQQTKMQPSQ